MTRAERSARNKRAHAIRRAIVAEEWRDARRAGRPAVWRELAAAVDAMTTDDVLAAFDTPAETMPAPAVMAEHRPIRRNVLTRASAEYQLALAAWERGLEAAVAGGRTVANGGRPARGERWTDEETVYRAEHPRPSWSDFVTQTAATMRHERRAA